MDLVIDTNIGRTCAIIFDRDIYKAEETVKMARPTTLVFAVQLIFVLFIYGE